MRTHAVFAILFSAAAVVYADNNSVEVALEEGTPPPVRHFPTPAPSPPHERPVRGPYDGYSSWRFRFLTAPDKQLGTRTDIAAIESQLPAADTRNIRWISRSVAVACAARTLYVFEKHGLEWQIVHHWSTRETTFP